MGVVATNKSLYVTQPAADESLWRKCGLVPLFAKGQGSLSPMGWTWLQNIKGKREYQDDKAKQELFGPAMVTRG